MVNHTKMLFTGFGPFGRHRDNPSEAIVLSSSGVDKLVLPVDVNGATKMLLDAYASRKYDVVVHFGLHPRSRSVRVERVAINMDDFTIPDNSGRSPVEERIDPDGPDGIISRVSARKLVSHLIGEGFSARVSNSAGTYLCNHIYYVSMRHFQKKGEGSSVLFIHVPKDRYLPRPQYPVLASAVASYFGGKA